MSSPNLHHSLGTRRTTGSTNRRLVAALSFLGLCLVLLAVWLLPQLLPSSSANTTSQTGLKYGRQAMVWAQGPQVQSTRVTLLGQLPALLPKVLAPTVRNDVNIPDLVHRYGGTRKIELVVLTGVYNSLPPDEGIEVHGQVMVLVDARTNRVLYLMD